PTLLAHASLGGVDIAVTACLVALLYHFRVGRESSWPGRLALPTIWFAASLLAKASGLVFAPLCMLVIEGERLARQGFLRRPCLSGWRLWLRDSWQQLRRFRRDLAVMFVGALVLVFVYCGCDWEVEPSFVDWARSLPEGRARQVMVWLAEHLCIFCNA